MTVALPSRVVIATRESALAMWQAHHVRDALRALHPGLDVVIDGMTTQGDRILDRSLAKVGGKGLFVKELETALLDGRADLAVHSLKDVPMQLHEGLVLGAILVREDARDAFVSPRHASLDSMPEGAVVGTSSLRRESQLRARHPHLAVVGLRGNVGTRLAKLDRGDMDATLLAVAGLVRLGLEDRIRERIAPEVSVPAPGQGALAIEIDARRADLVALLGPLHDDATAAAVLAERAVSRTLGGNCTMPLGAHARWTDDGTLALDAVLGTSDGATMLRASDASRLHVRDTATADALGVRVGQRIVAHGGLALVAPH